MESEKINHSSSGGWCFQENLIHPRRVFASIQLRNSPDTHESIGMAAQHELLE
jgi:hypothetical protein